MALCRNKEKGSGMSDPYHAVKSTNQEFVMAQRHTQKAQWKSKRPQKTAYIPTERDHLSVDSAPNFSKLKKSECDA